MKRYKYNDNVYNFLKTKAKYYTIKELAQIIKENYKMETSNKQLAQYCIKNCIKYKYEKPKKAHSNKPTVNGTIAIKTDGDMLKIKTNNHKWEYLQRKIYEDYYKVQLPEDVYVIFLNQNKRDFNIKNLKAISRRSSAIMSKDELFSTEAKITKIGYVLSKIKIKTIERRINNDKINKEPIL